MMRAGTPATTVLGATFFVMTAPSPKASGWPNEVSPQGRKSPSGLHRLLFLGDGSRRQSIAKVIQTAYDLGGREIAKDGHVVLRSGVTTFFIYATSPSRA